MKIALVMVGNTREEWLKTGIGYYTGKLKHYADFSLVEIKLPRALASLPREKVMEEEAARLLHHLTPFDEVVLLDEGGESMGSVDFSDWLRKRMNAGARRMAFVVGGAYGYSGTLLSKGYTRISLSPMTFSHQMVRLVFVEQLYRAFTILKGERYHHG